MEKYLQIAVDTSEKIRTSLGPSSRDKLIVRENGEILCTNDGRTLLEEMKIEHPIGKLIVNLSKNQDKIVGDGTTSVVVLCGQLCKNAIRLLKKGYQPATIITGYKIALNEALKELKSLIIEDNSLSLKNSLIRAAKSCLLTKMVKKDADLLAKICVDAVCMCSDLVRKDVNLNLIKLDYAENGTLDQTKLFHGIVLNKRFSHENMKNKLQNARIAVFSCPLEVPRPKTKFSINVTNEEDYKELQKIEGNYYKKICDKIKESGANVVICQWGIDHAINHFLMSNGMIGVTWVVGDDLERVAMAVGASICSRVDDLKKENLGFAELIHQDDQFVFIENCENPKACSILVRGSNKVICEDALRSLYDALCNVKNSIIDGGVVAGGGATEIELFLKMENFAINHEYYEPIKLWGESLLYIPYTIAENAGLNPNDVIYDLIHKHKELKFFGIKVDGETKLMDMSKSDVFENIKVKETILKLATEMACMILKIDDVIIVE